jgi:hypothetical protein
MRRIDLTDQRFGRLVVVDYSHAKSGNAVWRCRCDCGKEALVLGDNLKRGTTTTCGCIRPGWKNRTHGHTAKGVISSLYGRWAAMKRRCLNPNCREFKNYGGRGIAICDRWRDSFEAFREDMGDPPPRRFLDRIDNNGDYTPANCKWSTPKQSNRNKRRNGGLPGIRVDLSGQRFARLAAVSVSHRTKRDTYFACRCDCGTDIVVRGGNLRTGHTRSCGCLHREQASNNLTQWQNAKTRAATALR